MKMQCIPNYGRMIEEEQEGNCLVIFESNMNKSRKCWITHQQCERSS